MKRRIYLVMVALMVSSIIVGCGKKEEVSDISSNVQEQIVEEAFSIEEQDEEQGDKSSAELILDAIEADYATAIKKMQEELESAKKEIGTTYEDYVKNKEVLDEWYAFIFAESETLFEKTEKNSIKYFKEIATTEDADFINDAMDEYYDVVYDDMMDDYYEAIYDDAMDEVYDVYYGGIVADGYEVAEFDEWNDESSECFENWSDTQSEIYELWSDAQSNYYDMWSDVSGEFWNENYDLEQIFKEYADKNKNTEMDENSGESEEMADSEDGDEISETEENESETDESDDAIDPEFKAAMDSYEKFFDEYVDFMKKYMNAGPEDVMAMMGDYAEYLEQYTETMKKMEELEGEDMTVAEAAYYAEVTGRITQKLLEVQ